MDINNYINKIIDESARYHLKRAFQRWGIERTEEKLKELYKHMPVILEKYLQIYRTIIREKHEV